MTEHPTKITFGEMRDMGVRGVLIYCADYQCSHSIAVMADQWPDDLRFFDIEPRFVRGACGKRGPMCGRISIGARCRPVGWAIDENCFRGIRTTSD
jgi:hypothetical protein